MSLVHKVVSSVGRLQPKHTLFLLCDVQEKFRTVIPHFEAMVNNTQKLLEAGRVLDVPLIVTEQYPERLGNTVKELEIGHKAALYSKSLFSMVTPDVKAKIDELFCAEKKLESVVLFGIEVCFCRNEIICIRHLRYRLFSPQQTRFFRLTFALNKRPWICAI